MHEPASVANATSAELEAGLDAVRQSPKDGGALVMIVRRPAVGQREMIDEGRLDLEEGLAGDSWRRRRSPQPDMQLNLMNARVLALVAGERSRWPLAGDQLIVDLDLSADNLPAGIWLAIGSAVIEVTSRPHTGCRKFADRYGQDAVRFVNAPAWKALRLRGINAKVHEPGVIRVGDTVTKL